MLLRLVYSAISTLDYKASKDLSLVQGPIESLIFRNKGGNCYDTLTGALVPLFRLVLDI